MQVRRPRLKIPTLVADFPCCIEISLRVKVRQFVACLPRAFLRIEAPDLGQTYRRAPDAIRQVLITDGPYTTSGLSESYGGDEHGLATLESGFLGQCADGCRAQLVP